MPRSAVFCSLRCLVSLNLFRKAVPALLAACVIAPVVAAQATTPTTSTLSEVQNPGAGFNLTCMVAGVATSAPTGSVTFNDLTEGRTLGTAGLAPYGSGFSTPVATGGETDASFIAAADFNGDGIDDLAINNSYYDPNHNGFSNGIDIRLGNGDGTLSSPLTLTLLENPWDLIAAQFTSSGRWDLAVTTQSGSSTALVILLGDGEGRFTQNYYYLPTTSLGRLVSADFNKDGNNDIAVIGQGGSLYVFLGSGNGTFTALPPASISTAIFEWGVVANLTSSGYPDLIINSSNGNDQSTGVVLLGNGDGTFRTGQNLPHLVQVSYALVAADLNGDGNQDLTLSQGTPIGRTATEPGGIAVLLGNGDGTFQSPVYYDNGLSSQYAATGELLQAGDFFGNGRIDIVVGGAEGSSPIFYPGVGDGTFGAPITGDFAIVGLAKGNFSGTAALGLAASAISLTTGTRTIYVWPTIPAYSAAKAVLNNVLFASLTDQAHQVDCSYGSDTNNASSTSAALSLAYQKLPTPTFNPVSGNYTGGISVSITSNSAAGIYYTTDGSSPTSASTLYTGPIPVSSSLTIKAIAFGTGYADSDVATAAYILQTVTPTFTPGSGIFGTPIDVTISDSDSSAVIYYTTDGSDPTISSARYTSPIRVTGTETIKAIAASPYFLPSGVSSATYTFEPVPGPPVISPPGGAYKQSSPDIQVTITGPSGATVYYTTDGTTPTTSSTQYTGPFSVTGNVSPDGVTVLGVAVVQAIAVAPSQINSPVASAVYDLNTTFANAFTSPSVGLGPLECTVTGLAVFGPSLTGSVTFNDLTAGQSLDTQPLSTVSQRFLPAVYSVNKGLAGSPFIVGDFNGDKKLDIVAVGGVLLGNGDGTFQPLIPLSGLGGEPIAADINEDGKLDLIADNVRGFVTLLGNGDGTFQAPVLHDLSSLGLPSLGLAAGDFGNGHTDVAATVNKNGVNSVYVLMGNGDGSFQSPVNVASGALNPILTGDFDGDKKLDLAFYSEAGVSVILGNGDGTFQPPVSTALASTLSGYPVSLVAGDFNHDGRTDLLVSMNGVDEFLGNGDGTFQEHLVVGLSSAVNSITTGDFFHRGITDFALTQGEGQYSYPLIWAGNGDGTFAAVKGTVLPRPANGGQVTGLVAADFNGDGYSDLSFWSSTLQVAMGTAAVSSTAVSNDFFLPNGESPITRDYDCSYGGDSNFQGSTSGQLTHAFYALSPPQFSLLVGNYSAQQTVSISSSSVYNPVSYYYTTDGSTPTPSSAKYTGPISISTTTKLKAITAAPGAQTSAVSEAVYTITSTPQFSLPAGQYTPGQTVTITDANAGGTIYYTKDGSAPTAQSPKYTAPVPLTGNVTLKAMAIAPGYLYSAVASASYTSSQPATSKTSITASATSANVGQQITLTATVIGASPTGSVTFAAGSTTLGQAALTNATATLQTSFAAAGTYSVTATYAGDANNTASTSSAVSITVTAPGIDPGTPPAPKSVPPGGTATYPLTFSAQGGYTGTISLSCTGLPAQSTCSFNPATLTLTGSASQSSTMSIVTTAPSSALAKPAGRPGEPLRAPLFFAGLAGLLFGLTRMRRFSARLRTLACVLLLAGAAIFAAGCGGGGSNSGGTGNAGTPAGTYTVTVTAQDSTNNVKQTLTVTLTVQ